MKTNTQFAVFGTDGDRPPEMPLGEALATIRRIADPDSFLPSKHAAVIDAFTGLLIDLKLQLAGVSPEAAGWAHSQPVTLDRLNELTRLLRTLDECKDGSYRLRY